MRTGSIAPVVRALGVIALGVIAGSLIGCTAGRPGGAAADWPARFQSLERMRLVAARTDRADSGGAVPRTHRPVVPEPRLETTGEPTPETVWAADRTPPRPGVWSTGLHPAAFDLKPARVPARGSPPDTRTTVSDGRHGRVPLPRFRDTLRRDLADFPAVFWEDTKAVYGDKTNLLILGLTYGASLALQETGPDDTIERSFRDHNHHTFGKGFRDVFATAGNPAVHFGAAGLWYLVGQRTQNEKTYAVGTKLFRALTLNGVSVVIGQAASADNGPNGEYGAFPSGHASSAFVFASVLDHEYGPWVGVPLYGLGALVAFERVEDDEHYLSDVVMGSVMGLVIGHTVAGNDEPPELFGGRLVPYADPQSASTGIAWVRSIPYDRRRR